MKFFAGLSTGLGLANAGKSFGAEVASALIGLTYSSASVERSSVNCTSNEQKSTPGTHLLLFKERKKKKKNTRILNEMTGMN